MSGRFNVYDVKEDLFLGYNPDGSHRVWTTFDKLGVSISYTFIFEHKIEEFINCIKDGSWKDIGYAEGFIRPIIAAMPNVWLVKIDISAHRVDYSHGIKI